MQEATKVRSPCYRGRRPVPRGIHHPRGNMPPSLDHPLLAYRQGKMQMHTQEALFDEFLGEKTESSGAVYETEPEA